jgi:MYXO-CTERM domain-containing protein
VRHLTRQAASRPHPSISPAIGRRCVSVAAAALSLAAATGSAQAAPARGTVDDPIVVDAFPYVVKGDTAAAMGAAIGGYGCGQGIDESGAEQVYRFELPTDAKVTAWIEGDGNGVDVDVHLLSDLTVDGGGIAAACADRDDVLVEADMTAGTRYVVVDTYNGDAQAGAYVLHLYAIGDEWLEWPVGEGVTWRARRYPNLAGGLQVIHLLQLDLDTPGVAIRPTLPSNGSCQRVADTANAQPTRPVAAINSSFFSGSCQSLSFMKSDGTLLTPNGASEDRGAFGITPSGELVVGRTALGADWPEVVTGQGGMPLLVEGGVALTDAEFDAEGTPTGSWRSVNPRTFVTVDDAGLVHFGTADGRGPARGLPLADEAAWMISELAALGGVNLDGGGSTTMWVDGVIPGGVVNYPSDSAVNEPDDHSGSRAVVGAVLVYANPYNHPPRFQTTPGTAASVGTPYAYDADALDLDPSDAVTFALVRGPAGMVVDGATGELTFTPTLDAPPMAEVELEARDGRGGVGTQTFTLVIDGAMGTGTTSDASTGDSDSSGSDSAGSTGSATDATGTTATGTGAGTGAGTSGSGAATSSGSSAASTAASGTGATDGLATDGAGASADGDEGCACRTTAPGPRPLDLGWGAFALAAVSVVTRRRPHLHRE